MAEEITYPTPKNIPEVKGVDLVAGEDEFLNVDGKLIPATPVATDTASETGLNVPIPTAPPGEPIIRPMVENGKEKPDWYSPSSLGQIQSTDTALDQMTTAEGATGDLSEGSQIKYGDVTGQVSPDSLAQDVSETLDPKATTQYQLAELLKSIEEGKDLPPWASPAVRRVGAIMNARGMGASSMASAAMIQAIMESGVPIAQADAQAHATIQLKNLDYKQKAALQNAMTYAQMDQANLNNRMKAASQNAQSFLTMDTQNLQNKQQAATLTYQSMVQALFTDTAAKNATKQLNAKTEVQVEEFFAELGSQVDAANKNRVAAMRQFNTSEKNAMEQFRVQTEDARNKFNVNMKYTISQANAAWRRQINTVNTATQNETNRINTQNLYNTSQAAQNFMWQKMRDNAAFNFQNVQSELQRQHQIGMLAMEFANTEKLYDQKSKTLLNTKIGEWIANWVTDNKKNA